MLNAEWGLRYEVWGKRYVESLNFESLNLWILNFESLNFEFWILNAECGILSRRAKLVYLLDARLRDFLTMTIDNDYDRFYGDAEVSALGWSGHCHGHKSSSRSLILNSYLIIKEGSVASAAGLFLSKHLRNSKDYPYLCIFGVCDNPKNVIIWYS